MVRPTHDEIIRDLSRELAVLNERVRSLDEKVQEIKRGLAEASQRRWSLLPPILGAIVNALLAALVA